MAAPLSSQRQTECTSQKRSCHSDRDTASCRNSLRMVGLIEGHLSSKDSWPLSFNIAATQAAPNEVTRVAAEPYSPSLALEAIGVAAVWIFTPSGKVGYV